MGLLKTLSLIGLLVLLIACFNFINLSTAQAFRRAKEVGIRKAIGGNRQSLVFQFLTDAGLLSSAAAVAAVLLSVMALPLLAHTLDIPLTTGDLFSWPAARFSAVFERLSAIGLASYSWMPPRATNWAPRMMWSSLSPPFAPVQPSRAAAGAATVTALKI